MNVDLSNSEVEFLNHLLDQWEHEEDAALADAVYVKINPSEQPTDDPGQLTLELFQDALILPP